ncbi:MAG: beta-galactosidase GalA [bacterium]
MKNNIKNLLHIAAIAFTAIILNLSEINAQSEISSQSVREKLLMDFGWKFALGHSYDTKKDFDNGSGYFSYLTKAGYGDGAAAQHFDDRSWRVLDLPHDWCVELPFDSRGGHSHGYKAIGRDFPENSIGWYRKTFFIPESDLGNRISIEFDGVHRNSIVWVNGFYLGNEHSGYTGFSYDITDYLQYGGSNTVAVRVDATMEEGWYYEGAGIYRHVWLTKTSPLHVARYGTFVTTHVKSDSADITMRTTVINESNEESVFEIEEIILDAGGNVIASLIRPELILEAGEQNEYFSYYTLANPKLWSLESPYLHKLKTVIRSNGKVVDNYETTFGIRTVRFDPDKGFFLNGRNVKIVGVNNHQDHAGVGTAIPDALQEFRIKRMKEMGCNGIRTAHNPPTPEFLDACDRIGMLVLDENRLMGVNEEHLNCLEKLIKRDRNHPSVVLWSLGNEEWAIEGNITGARIAATMQTFAQRFDSTRAFIAACSGGWDTGIGMVTEVMGYNYLVQGDIDVHHKKFPWQSSVGTEETNFKQTRGIYETDDLTAHMGMTKRMPENIEAETAWKFYAARPFLAGLFYWTGFDYRGESNPYVWPAVINQAGMVDLCGFPKDIFYYFKSWWRPEPSIHIFPHWNWKGSEGKEIPVTVYSNCEQVELFLNGKSLGKKEMKINDRLDWNVIYETGILEARGFKNGREIITAKIETISEPAAIQLIPDRNIIKADGADVSVITVQVNDANGVMAPIADNQINFTIEGPGKIIGVGNGDPSSHEAEKFLGSIVRAKIKNLKELPVENLENRPETSADFNCSSWKTALQYPAPKNWQTYTDSLIVIRGTFELLDFMNADEINLFTKNIVDNQSIYINGHLIASNIKRDDPNQSFRLDKNILKSGINSYAITGKRFRLKYQWDEPNKDPGLVQMIYPSEQWTRKAFNGLAQIIVQSTNQVGEIILTATSERLKPAVIKIQSEKTYLKEEVK